MLEKVAVGGQDQARIRCCESVFIRIHGTNKGVKGFILVIGIGIDFDRFIIAVTAQHLCVTIRSAIITVRSFSAVERISSARSSPLARVSVARSRSSENHTVYGGGAQSRREIRTDDADIDDLNPKFIFYNSFIYAGLNFLHDACACVR